MKKKEKKDKKVTVTMSWEQFLLLEHATEFMARAMEGQMDFTVQELMENAYEKRYQQEHPDYPTNRLAPEWKEVREKVERLLQQCREIVWNLPQRGPALYRYRNDLTPQTYWDMYQCLRYARYLDMDDKDKEDCKYTVMAYPPMRVGDEPLIKVEIK